MPAKSSRKTFAENVKRFRKARHMTQTGLAHLLGVDQSRVAEIESGKTNPTLETLDQLADAIEVSPAALLAPVEIQELVPA